MSIREALCATAVPIMVIVGATPELSEQEALRKALTFHASFDGKTPRDARRRGPGAPLGSFAERTAAREGGPAPRRRGPACSRCRPVWGRAALHEPEVSRGLLPRRSGTCPMILGLGGAVSFWLRVDPQAQLETGFCDPVQITPGRGTTPPFSSSSRSGPGRSRSDSGLMPTSTSGTPRNGSSTTSRWKNGRSSAWRIRRSQATDGPTWCSRSNVSTRAEPDGVAKLYLDGELRGTLRPRQQTFTWDARVDGDCPGPRLHRPARRAARSSGARSTPGKFATLNGLESGSDRTHSLTARVTYLGLCHVRTTFTVTPHPC